MKYTTRDLVTLAVFGALWGLVEIGLGSVLHAIKMPLTGLLLTVTGLMIAMIARLFVPRCGATLFVGVIATVLKLFSLGSVVIGPMIGILTAALLAELVLSAFRQPSRPAFLLAGGVAALWPVVQPFVTGLLIFGRDLLGIWLDLLDLGARLFGLPASAAVWIVILVLLLHAVIGAAGGWLAWSLGHLVIARLGRADGKAE